MPTTDELANQPNHDPVENALNQALAETVVATMMAQNFHWNVLGMSFGPLHALFQTIYEDHFLAQDLLAERIKSIGGHADGRLAAMLERAQVKDGDGHASERQMVELLAAAQATIAESLRAVADISERSQDLLTQDLAIGRGQVHEKFAWMLRAHLG